MPMFNKIAEYAFYVTIGILAMLVIITLVCSFIMLSIKIFGWWTFAALGFAILVAYGAFRAAIEDKHPYTDD